MSQNQCFTCGKSFNWTPFGQGTALKCAQCAQAQAIQQSARDSARAAERAASAASSSARIEEIRERARLQVEAQRRQEAAVRRAKEDLQAHLLSMTKEKCPWCGKVEAHQAKADWVRLYEPIGRDLTEKGHKVDTRNLWPSLSENLMEVAVEFTAKSWDAIEELGPKLADDSRLGAFPYCSRKCRHDCQEAGEAGDDAALIESLQNTRKEAHILTVSALEKRGGIEQAKKDALQKAKEAKESKKREEEEKQAEKKREREERKAAEGLLGFDGCLILALLVASGAFWLMLAINP